MNDAPDAMMLALVALADLALLLYLRRRRNRRKRAERIMTALHLAIGRVNAMTCGVEYRGRLTQGGIHANIADRTAEHLPA